MVENTQSSAFCFTHPLMKGIEVEKNMVGLARENKNSGSPPESCTHLHGSEVEKKHNIASHRLQTNMVWLVFFESRRSEVEKDTSSESPRVFFSFFVFLLSKLDR